MRLLSFTVLVSSNVSVAPSREPFVSRLGCDPERLGDFGPRPSRFDRPCDRSAFQAVGEPTERHDGCERRRRILG